MAGHDPDDDNKNLGKLHPNQFYDESLDLHDSEEVASQYDPTPRIFNKTNFIKDKQSMAAKNNEENDDEDDDGDNDDSMGMMGDSLVVPTTKHLNGLSANFKKKSVANENADSDDDNEDEEADEEDDNDEDDDDDDDDTETTKPMEGAYNSSDYDNLPVTSEVKELFQYITRYSPPSIELNFKLIPFIPDYIPAVGDIDAFLKIPRHDSKQDTLGLTILDEPCAKQSDPVVLELLLRSLSKETVVASKVSAKSIDIDQSDSSKHIDSWIKNIDSLHRSKPPPTVHYAKKMPEVDELMQEWSLDVEDVVKDMSFPIELDCDLAQMVDLVCGICDITVYNNKIHSLHLLFSLYSEFKNSQHFQSNHNLENSGY